MRKTTAAIGVGFLLCMTVFHVHAVPPNRALLQLLKAEPLNGGDQGPWRVSVEGLTSPARSLLLKRKDGVEICDVCIYSCCLDEDWWFYCCSEDDA